ncbi:orotidine-5'-phosphate decarboxylase [Leuconostoc rapi]|uniref:orotidine-5'-phosphate decarboxylase n=1 Tax=Leuconostoc rapi TaxID=1406906 RepID=UPI00195CCDAD|nr:orotidine-5'-phosphate decarboxylase [Leuconostoc rapi]MBM7434980.1 orotidine-5'-phosphate decarboxylase [Leuconostoc rapi]
MIEPIFIALDFPDATAANTFLLPYLNRIVKPALKVGMELFYAEGPSFIRKLREQKFDVFLDLKLYDIPTTVGHAVASLAKLDVQYLTVHAAGGEKMLREAVANKGEHMKLLAVTQLTSFSEIDMQVTQLTNASMSESVTHLAKLAYDAGIDGTISSPLEANLIKENTSDSFLRITPGIRLAGDQADDQARIMTPKAAHENGATGLVIGRSITKAAQPIAAYERVLKEWSN